MQMAGSIIGIVSAVATLVFWGIFSFDNPYQAPNSEVIGNLFVSAVVPAAFWNYSILWPCINRVFHQFFIHYV